MVIFTARQNLANLNEVKMNLIVKFANFAGESYNKMHDPPHDCFDGDSGKTVTMNRSYGPYCFYLMVICD